MPWRVTFEIVGRGQEQKETQVFEQDEIVVGRTPRTADLVFPRDNVSRRHCKFVVHEDGAVRIIDLQSSNGTWVNGMKAVDQIFELGDELMAGDRLVRLAKAPERVDVEPLAIHELVAHPQSKGRAVERVHVVVSAVAGDLVVRYVVEGDMERLAVPRSRLDPERLWEHTCLEMFVGGPSATDYAEWNFSPSGQSARFTFSDYRKRTGHDVAEARVRVEQGSDALVLTARDAFVDHTPAQIGLTAITRDEDGAQSFWALAHPTERPDFHHRGGFAWELR